MTRYFYFPHSNKELPITKHYQLDTLVWVLEPATFTPVQIQFCNTKESWLLFETRQACINFYA